MNLKGQNFRVLLHDSSSNKYKCVAMATNCTVTLTGNTEDASTKDDVGMATKPTITNRAWQVSVESLNVTDVAAMLAAIKNFTTFELIWDETDTTDNQTPVPSTYANGGSAFLSDATFTFNDRENSSKQLTFQGTGPLNSISQTPTYETVSVNTYTKGQYVRLFLGNDNTTTPSKVIAFAKQLSLHVALSMEESTTKDTVGDWSIQQPTALSFDISTNALVRSGETINSAVEAQGLAQLESIYKNSNPVKFEIANVSGQNNRTKSSVIVGGSVQLTQLTINGLNRQDASYSAQFQGWGAYDVEAA